MFVAELDRDMSDVIPESMSVDSEFLFAQMTERLREAVRGRGRILDVAAGLGQDADALGRGAIAVEPSRRMSDLARFVASNAARSPPPFVRAWSDALPFADESFDAVFCKGALDHFDAPERAIDEMARVTKPEGRVVFAVANFSSLSCRVGRLRVRIGAAGHGERQAGRRHFDVPSDHFTRYDSALLREQIGRAVVIDTWQGISLAWGAAFWPRLPDRAARAFLFALDRAARRLPSLADVLLIAGRPRASMTAR